MTTPLLDAAVQACGDPARWDRLTTVRVRLRVGGNILASKLCSPWQRPYLVEVSPRKVHAVLSPFGRSGGRGLFAGDSVRIESPSGQLLGERHDARAHARASRRWDDLDLLYFLGYAFWNYVNTPFLFRWDGFETCEIEPWRDPASGTEQRRLRVRFPPGLPTHCPEQVFYFDAQGTLTRLDYSADVFTSRLRGAHLCLAPRRWDSGFVFAAHRRVVPYRRDLSPILWAPAAMEGFIEDVQAD